MTDNSDRHIVVTGPMGVGKTTVGRMLAEELGLRFLDSDESLEARTDQTAAEIARKEGVQRLHELELEVFLDMCRSHERQVMAPASSVVDHREGRTAMSENLTIWLTAPDRIVAMRQGSGGHRRPIDEPARTRLRAKRSPHLDAVSSIVIDTGSSTPEEVVDDILERLSGDEPRS